MIDYVHSMADTERLEPKALAAMQDAIEEQIARIGYFHVTIAVAVLIAT